MAQSTCSSSRDPESVPSIQVIVQDTVTPVQGNQCPLWPSWAPGTHGTDIHACKIVIDIKLKKLKH